MRDAESARLMTVIEGLRVDPIELAHGLGEIGFRRFHQQMEMVVHQAVSMGQKVEARDHAP